MGGLVMGLDVRPATDAPAPNKTVTSTASAEAFQLFANRRAGVFGTQDGYGFIVQNAARQPARDSIRIPGTPLILTRGVPVQITVHNRLPFPFSVHWHGIELDSYFDGVGDFSGSGNQIAAMIQPEDSFVVRFTPPRAGAYIYHVHGETGEQLASGLYAPLLVLEPGQRFDPGTDLVFVFADGGPGGGNPIFVNGTATPDTLRLVAGREYRVRGIYIAADDVYFTTLHGPAGPVHIRQLGLDGHDLPGGALESPFNFPTGPGHTRDLTLRLEPGEYRLTVQRYAYTTVYRGRERPDNDSTDSRAYAVTAANDQSRTELTKETERRVTPGRDPGRSRDAVAITCCVNSDARSV
jgi:FtsP/CotA-like multicopper oxidase with cupredoxin domain